MTHKAVTATRVLLIEDQQSEAMLLTRLLKHSSGIGFSIDHASSLADAIFTLAASEYDICLLDLGLPDGQGIDSLHRIRAVDARLPIVVLTGNDDEELGLLAIETGAQDFMAKSNVSTQLVTRSLRYSMARHKKMLGYAADANTDVLTGLPNRRQLNQRFNELLATCNRLTIALIDIDHFKRINDRHGHLVGDQVLKQLSEIIQFTLGEHAQAARFGGEEFALLIPEASSEYALSLVKGLLSEIAAAPFQFEETRLTVTASAGISLVCKDETLEDILKRTDAALYEAKHGGRNRCCVQNAI